MTTVTLVGAGGKMGLRISANLVNTDYLMHYVEISQEGVQTLKERGIITVPTEGAVSNSNIVILAVPDTAIKPVAAEIVPLMRSGAMLVTLDPAAAYLGHLPDRTDISYFVSHPCHPSIFNDETELGARKDHFGGSKARQAIVCCLVQGREEDYAVGEQLACHMYAPTTCAHHITLEQMAILEPAMAETIGATLIAVLREAMDKAVEHGVPFAVARDFMLGHMNILSAVMFDEVSSPVSDACKVAMDYGRQHILQDGWEKLLGKDSIYDQISAMLASD